MIATCVALFIDIETGEINMKALKKADIRKDILHFANEQS